MQQLINSAITNQSTMVPSIFYFGSTYDHRYVEVVGVGNVCEVF